MIVRPVASRVTELEAADHGRPPVQNKLSASDLQRLKPPLAMFEVTGGETGGTLGEKDKEIRVRMGKFTLMGLTWARRDKWRNVYSLCWK